MANDRLLTILSASLDACGLRDVTLVVGVSGGTDSVALLLGLHELSNRLHLNLNLHLAHLDHGLRPDSADDAEFVKRLGHTLDLPFHLDRAEVREEAARRRLGVEEAARWARYRFLSGVAAGVGAAAVVVGHTADDQIETRMLHVVRGSGLRGLRGMSLDSTVVVPDALPVRVVRPLLMARRVDTQEFCRSRGLTPREDESNQDPSFVRNRLRHRVIPELRVVNPRVDDAFDRLARSAADADDFLEAELNRRLPNLARSSVNSWRIDRATWKELHPALKQALLRRAAASLARSRDGGDFGAIERGIEAADHGDTGLILDWPSELRLRIERDQIIVERPVAAPVSRPAPVELPREGEVELPSLPASLVGTGEDGEGARLNARRSERRCAADRDRWHLDLDLARIGEDPLVIRFREAGDWLAPEGMAGRKKLQDLLVDAHVPRVDRDAVPLLATADDIVWAVGLRRDRRFLAGPESRDVLCLKVEFDPRTSR